MSHIPKVLGAFARLLSYPDQQASQTAELLYVVLSDEIPEAARAMSQFGAFLEQHEGWQVEEAFTETFDVNPACALEVGWHLFGEEYARGMFLVRMRQEMRKYALAESAELPDHISHVLAIVAAMPEDEAARFVTACLQPAVEKMNDALATKESPYRHLLAALAAVIEQKWGASAAARPRQLLQSLSAGLDPLHAYPVAEIGCGGRCGTAGSEPHLVPLEVTIPVRDRSAGDHRE